LNNKEKNYYKKQIRLVTTVKQALDIYIEEYCEENKKKSLDTNIFNAKHLEKFFGNKRIRDLSTTNIREYKKLRLSKEKASTSTVRRELSVFKIALNVCIDEGIIKTGHEIHLIENLKIKKPSAGKRLVVPLFSEFDEIMKHLPTYMVTFCQGFLVYRHVDKRTQIDKTKTYAPWRKANIEAGCVVYKDGKEKSKYHIHDLRKHAIKFLKHKKKFPKDAIRTVFTGHKDVMVFEQVYNISSPDDNEYYRRDILAA